MDALLNSWYCRREGIRVFSMRGVTRLRQCCSRVFVFDSSAVLRHSSRRRDFRCQSEIWKGFVACASLLFCWFWAASSSGFGQIPMVFRSTPYDAVFQFSRWFWTLSPNINQCSTRPSLYSGERTVFLFNGNINEVWPPLQHWKFAGPFHFGNHFSVPLYFVVCSHWPRPVCWCEAWAR